MQQKELTLEGKVFIVKKFTPEVGCFWAFRFFGNVATLTGEGFAEKVKEFINLTTKDRPAFKQFQQDCLGVVLVKLDAGLFPVMNDEGFLAVPDLSMVTVFELTLEAFMFSISDFFEKAQMGKMWGIILGSFQKTGTENSSSSP